MVVIVFDLETSGLNPYHDDIIEIGAKVYGSDNNFQCLLRPKSNRPISKKITVITGITNKILREEGKDWSTAYIEFYNWIYEIADKALQSEEEVTIVSHNGLTFDFIFLKKLLKDLAVECNYDLRKFYSIFPKFHLVDTLLLSKRLLPGRSYYSQPSLAKTFQIVINNEHRAMGDVIVLEQLYMKLMVELSKQNIDGIVEPSKVIDYIDLRI